MARDDAQSGGSLHLPSEDRRQKIKLEAGTEASTLGKLSGNTNNPIRTIPLAKCLMRLHL